MGNLMPKCWPSRRVHHTGLFSTCQTSQDFCAVAIESIFCLFSPLGEEPYIIMWEAAQGLAGGGSRPLAECGGSEWALGSPWEQMA